MKTEQQRALGHGNLHKKTNSAGSGSQFSGVRKLSVTGGGYGLTLEPSLGHRSRSPSLASVSQEDDHSSSHMSGSAIWVGGTDDAHGGGDQTMRDERGRKISMDRRSSMSSSMHQSVGGGPVKTSSDGHGGKTANHRHHMVRDTHFFETSISYKEYTLPIKMPVFTFPEEVGDVCFFLYVNCLMHLLTSSLRSVFSYPTHPDVFWCE